MPVSRLLWQVMELELAAWGQVTQRLDDFKKLPPIRDYPREIDRRCSPVASVAARALVGAWHAKPSIKGLWQ